MQVNVRDLSYGKIAQSRMGEWGIRTLENLSGRPNVLWHMRNLETELGSSDAIWDVILKMFKLRVHVEGQVPTTGPLLTVSNHPYGILDGLALGKILHDARDDFQIIANDVFEKAPPLAPYILPINFEMNRAAAKANLQSRNKALARLAAGGTIGVFPGGATSAPVRRFGPIIDPDWRNFTARLLTGDLPQIVPIYFHGTNGPVFQNAGFVHPNLRHALQINQFWRRIGSEIRVTIGDPINPHNVLAQRDRPEHLMQYLRAQTYALGPDAPLDQEGTRF